MHKDNRDSYHIWQQVFETWYDPLCNYAYSYTKDRNACEDIVQEVFVRIWEDRPQLIATDGVRYYLFTAVRNNCISYLRKTNKHDSGDPDEVRPVFIQHKTEQAEYRELVRQAIGILPPKCREVFLLSRFSNMTYKEIASSLDISEKTVENQMSKALKLMRAFLKDNGIYLMWALANFLISK
jgi:RNA polymerase sigma-70 factor (ECF subfamily)